MKFNLTINTMYHWFNEYNEKYFDNELFMPDFKIKKTKSYLGKAFCLKNVLIISTYLDRTEKEYQNTFIHEMIHFWQWQNYRMVDHKETFRRKAAEINKDGWQIKRCSDINGAKVQSVRKDDVILANFEFYGRNCFTKINPNCLTSVVSKFKNHPLVHNFKTYRCTNNTNIDKIPELRKATRYWYDCNYAKSMAEAINHGTEFELLSVRRNK